MSKVLIYVLRRDLRLGDNPVFANIGQSFKQSHQPYTHVLPLYVVPAQQVEVSGFLAPSSSTSSSSPYPEARSAVAGFWRCGPNRARFLAESVWDLRRSLQDAGCGLTIRMGMLGQVVDGLLADYGAHGQDPNVYQVWMTAEEGEEERREEEAVRKAVEKHNKVFKLWTDEKYFVHDDDVPLQDVSKLPDVFSSYKKMVEPLRSAPRRSLPKPDRLPPLPSYIPQQSTPFIVPSDEQEFTSRLVQPVEDSGLANPPQWPAEARSAHPFKGGEKAAHKRVQHYIESGAASTYKDTRNGLLGEDFSTKFSAWLALGCISARQIHEYLVAFEDGSSPLGKGAKGYGGGENKGTGWVRFELLWRDYFRLCTRKFATSLFHVNGFKGQVKARGEGPGDSWKYLEGSDDAVKDQVRRFLEGTTGTGLVDASQRELLLTGWTSNRARQNVASYLAKHLGIDWRIGAEWYEYCLVDYDVSSNWGNWQYNAGVGNDPRESRVFNPVKQGFDYDSGGEYVKTWVPELRGVDEAQYIFQPWVMPAELKEASGLKGAEMTENPLKKISFKPGGKNKGGGSGGKRHVQRKSQAD